MAKDYDSSVKSFAKAVRDLRDAEAAYAVASAVLTAAKLTEATSREELAEACKALAADP